MPLHLLSKKSWNVYNPAAIARVRADEAAAAAREEAYEQQLQEYEAAKRLALLRGEEPAPAPAPLPDQHDGSSTRHSEKRAADPGKEERRKRRKLAGEDDTDRDIRVARMQEEDRRARRDEAAEPNGRRGRRQEQDVPIVDHAGHIQLFAPPSTREIRAQKEMEGQAARKDSGKEEEAADAGALRFVDAAGFRKKPDTKPWYASGYSGTEELNVKGGRDYGDGDESTGRDAFGNEDPGRAKRDAVRLSTADPMAAMAKAQSKLKEVERARKASNREREQELEDLKMMQREDARRERRKRERQTDKLRTERRKDDEDSLEEFNLGTSKDAREPHSNSTRHYRHHHHHHKHRHEDRSRDRDHREGLDYRERDSPREREHRRHSHHHHHHNQNHGRDSHRTRESK